MKPVVEIDTDAYVCPRCEGNGCARCGGRGETRDEPKLYRITCVCGQEADALAYAANAKHACPECGEDWEGPVDEALCEARGPEDDGDPRECDIQDSVCLED